MTLDAHIAQDTELVRLLTPEGERLEHPEYPLTLSDQQLRDLYRDLVVVRTLDGESVALTRQGELGLWPSLLGQEAAQVGSGYAARAQDHIFPAYREHAVGRTGEIGRIEGYPGEASFWGLLDALIAKLPQPTTPALAIIQAKM